MKRIVGTWILCLATGVSALSQVDTSFIYNTAMPYGTLDLRLAKSPTRYYYLQEDTTFSYRESAPGVKTNTYTSMTTWNTSAYGQGNLREVNGTSNRFVMNYRLLKPKGYDPTYSPGYPIIIMFHGGGEAANCWIDTRCHWATASYNPVTNSPPAPTDQFHKLLNNDRNLLHGGAQHLTAVNLAGTRLPDDPGMPDKAFPGFVLFPQSLNGWGPHAMVEDAIRILRLIIKKYNIDENRVYIHGLSNGGAGVYQALKRAPWLFAAALPMSAVNDGGIVSQGMVSEVAKLPLWIFQGGQDINPTPSRTYGYVRAFRRAGGNVRYYFYPNLGHGTWNTAYREPDFFSWILDKRKNNPHIYFGEPVICNTTQTGVRMGFSNGFFAYQWQRDGQIIAGATGAEFTANTPGTYRGRFSRRPNPTANDWEPWSDPIVVSEMTPVKPPIEVIGTAHLRGPGLASTDENNTVKLRSIDSAELYVWFKGGTELNFSGTDVDDTLRTVTFTSAFSGGNGAYTLVTYNNNCPSPPSDPVNLFFNDSSPRNITIAAGPVDLKGTATASSIFLSWNDVSGLETGYEVWRRRAGTPDFRFVAKTGEDAVSYHDINLDPGTTYEYKLRAVNNNGRSNYVPSDDLNVNSSFTTLGDTRFPPPPQDLTVVTNTLNEITLSWKAAKDESSIKEYWVYYRNDSVNTGSNATVYTLAGLTQNSVYPITVRAVDYGNHWSQPSNQIIATTYLTGLVYKHSTGAWESLDDSAMVATWNSPEFTGTVPNFTLQPRTQDDYFNFQFIGYLSIETEGTYYFNLTSSDGSRLILDGNMIINNDGLHGTRTVASEAVYLTAGPHPIEVQYFDDVGGHTLNVRYRGPGIEDGATFVAIPDAALRSGNYIPPVPPVAPTGVVATGAGMQRIDVAWVFADDGETDYEVYRATAASGPFEIVARASTLQAVDTIALVPGTVYYYRVKTVNANGSSGFSNTASAATTVDGVAPTVPQNLRLISKTLTNLAFSWDPSGDNVGVSGYEIFSGAELIGTSTIHAFTAQNLDPDTQYAFTVKAVDAGGNRSAASAELVVVTNTSATFYSLASGNLNELSTWKRNPDGTGESPQNFSDNGQYFKVTNRTSATLGGPWKIGGNSSRVVIPAGVTVTADQLFEANVELQGNATLKLNHTSIPDLIKLSPESTVNFNGPSTIPAHTYGNVMLSGSVVKTFDADTISILGNLTVNGGLPLKGAPHNGSHIRLAGSLTLNGTRPETAADNTPDVAFTGAGGQTITTGGNLYLYRVIVSGNRTVNVVSSSGSKIAVHLGSLKGGGLLLSGGAVFQINEHDLVLGDAAVINPGEQSGSIAVDGGEIYLASTAGQNSYLSFSPLRNTVSRLTIDLTGVGQAFVRTPLQISEGIKILSGNLASEGHVKLLANHEQAAVIYEIGNGGSISSEVTVQQFIPASGNGFRYLSSPVNNVTVGEWQQSFPITGPFSGASPGGSDPSLFLYRESSGGWVAYPAPGGSHTAPIERGAGYAARMENSDVLVSVKGVPYQGDIAFNLAAGSDGSDGWNLVGNPYASPVLWSNSSDAWTLTGVNNVIAVRRNHFVDGHARSQVVYYDRSLGGGVIDQGEAFWVKTFQTSPVLSVREKAKTDSATIPDQRSVTVSLRQGEVSDPAYILFADQGTDEFDAQLDGRKLKNYGMFNFSTLAADTVALAVNHVSADYCSKTVPLNVQDVQPGSYALSFTNLGLLTDVGEIALIDHFAGTTTTVTGGDYAFVVTDDPASYGRERFALRFTRDQLDLTTPAASAPDVCAPGPASVIIANSQEDVLYQVLDDTGKVISDLVAGNGTSIEIGIFDGELDAGDNMIEVTAGFSGCDRQQLGTAITIRYISGVDVTSAGDVSVCEGGDVTLEASGAPDGGSYKWFDAAGTLIEGETSGTLLVTGVSTESVYYVSATHPDGCESERAEIHIYPDTLDMPVVLVIADTLFTDVVGYYQWKKDGEEIPGATLNYFVPAGPGTYSVAASNGGCIKESEPYLVEEAPITGIDTYYNGEFVIHIYPVPSSGEKFTITLQSPKSNAVLIEIVDAMGRLHYRNLIDADVLKLGTDLVPSSPLYNGVYILRATQAPYEVRRKIVVER